MIEITIDEKACRGCELCSDICQKEMKALGFDENKRKAIVEETKNCIGCLSCVYACPSNAINITGHHVVPNFYRDLDFIEKLRNFI
jgi:ferredoxin